VAAQRAWLDALNDEQREAVTFSGKSLLILAGAGSGKTRVITTRIAWLIAEGRCRSHEILAVTFTNKAAREMNERVRSFIGGTEGALIRTFHSFCAYLLRRYAEAASLDPHFTIYDDDDSAELLAACFPSEKRTDLKPYSRMISRAKDYLLGPDDDLSVVSRDPKFRERYEAYQRRLDATGNCDFGELISRSVSLLSSNRDIRERLQSRFRYILVDEYQDSNVAQFELLKVLNGSDTSLCVVGDDDQSIYRFRGAEVQNIVGFPDQFPGTKIVRLERNYRSTAPILELASAVVSNNRGRLGKTLWTDRTGGSLPVVAYLGDQEEEARYCLDLLADRRYADTAILYRTNAQSVNFETLFGRAGIPYRLVGALRFYEREEVKDGIALLSLFANPRDEVAFRRIVNKPARGIGAVTIGRIVEHAAGGNLVEAAVSYATSASGKTRSGLAAWNELVSGFEGLIDTMPLPVFVQTVIEQSGLLAYHRDQDEVAGSSRVRNLEELVNASAEFEGGREGLSGFLELVELDRSRFEEDDGTGDAVTLITMHNTKGLEFPRVIITGLDEGLFPGWRIDSDDDLEEERRIFYVSVTRAMDELYLTTCRTRRLWGRSAFFEPSRFLSEIPEGMIDARGTGRDGPGGHKGEDHRNDYPVGTGVYHDSYGYGTVIRSWRTGGESSVLVRFETGRVAQFLPEYTPLERMESDV
jgi:DNA helicase II / ATP-dependent DNA helicase PcrA